MRSFEIKQKNFWSLAGKILILKMKTGQLAYHVQGSFFKVF